MHQVHMEIEDPCYNQRFRTHNNIFKVGGKLIQKYRSIEVMGGGRQRAIIRIQRLEALIIQSEIQKNHVLFHPQTKQQKIHETKCRCHRQVDLIAAESSWIDNHEKKDLWYKPNPGLSAMFPLERRNQCYCQQHGQ